MLKLRISGVCCDRTVGAHQPGGFALPRNRTRDNDPPFDFTKRSAPIGRREKLHERMERELTNLMRDRRYWDGDPDYRAHVKRQFERVYNDPTGKPSPLRIGPPKIFATEIEPFGVEGDRMRALRDSRGEVSVASSMVQAASSAPEDLKPAPAAVRPPIQEVGTSKTMRGGPPSVDQDSDLFAMTPPGFPPKAPDERRRGSMYFDDSEPSDLAKIYDFYRIKWAGEGSPLQRAHTQSRLLLEVFKRYGWDSAERALRHYLDGSGKPFTVSPEVLEQYPTLGQAYETVLKHFAEWLVGVLPDSQHGSPELPIRDGDKLTIGVPPGHYQKDLDQLIRWEAAIKSAVSRYDRDPIALRELGSESHAIFGAAKLQGFANTLVLVRDGDLIRISGELTFRAWDKYDFAEDDSFRFWELERAGLAKSFEITTGTWRLQVEGFITLRDGKPIRSEIKLVDFDVSGEITTVEQENPIIDDSYLLGP